MSTRSKKIGVAGFVVTALIATFFGAGYQMGFRINETESAPSGVWRVKPVQSVKAGDLVEACPPDLPVVRVMLERGYLVQGRCAAGVIPLLKAVAAVEGETVAIQHGKPAAVDGRELPNTAALSAIPAFPDGSYLVKPGTVWLFSTYSSGSFDSRYFGPVELEQITGQAFPVWVKGDAQQMKLIGGESK